MSNINWESIEFPGSRNNHEEGELRNRLHPEIASNANKLEIVKKLIKDNPFKRRDGLYGQEYYRISKEHPGYETKIMVPAGVSLAAYVAQRYDGKFPALTKISKSKFELVLETRVENHERFAVLTCKYFPDYKKYLHPGMSPDFRVYLDAAGILYAVVPRAVRKIIGMKKDRISAYAKEEYLTINMRQPGRPDIMLVTLEEESELKKEANARVKEEEARYFAHKRLSELPNAGGGLRTNKQLETLLEESSSDEEEEEKEKEKERKVYSTNVDPFMRRQTGKGTQYIASANRVKNMEEYYKENLERRLKLAENYNESVRKHYTGPKKTKPVLTGQYPVFPQRPRTMIGKMARGVKISLEKLGGYLTGEKKKVVKGKKIEFEKYGGLVPLGAPYRPHVEIF